METMKTAQTTEGLDPNTFQELLSSIEILNVADEDETQGLFTVGGVEVLPRQSVNIIAAQKKSGKTNFAGVLMAAAISRERQTLGGLVRVRLSDEAEADSALKILVIDTEQPLRDARRTLRRVMKTAGYDAAEQWHNYGITVLSFKDIDASETVRQKDGKKTVPAGSATFSRFTWVSLRNLSSRVGQRARIRAI